ncbi:hypothetical protein HPG69_008565 [Diceros bicornis minor]|uniref:Uncharacterized protein n=1 Tax=Diceros bicornis minor TaxID=77932 RepID=A0A7J7FA65_DICBM|nr:hypothetical protein HPG69_008565 [Diceros bicornis minor]
MCSVLTPGSTLGEPVTPHWVLDGRPWRMVTLEEPVLKLDTGLVALEAEGQELLLELEKNQGLITLSSNSSYYVHPWPAGGSKDFSTHKIFRTEQLLSWKGACGHRDPGDKGDMASLSHTTQIRVRGRDRGGRGNALPVALQIRRDRNAQPSSRPSCPDIFIWRLKKQVLANF